MSTNVKHHKPCVLETEIRSCTLLNYLTYFDDSGTLLEVALTLFIIVKRGRMKIEIVYFVGYRCSVLM